MICDNNIVLSLFELNFVIFSLTFQSYSPLYSFKAEKKSTQNLFSNADKAIIRTPLYDEQK